MKISKLLMNVVVVVSVLGFGSKVDASQKTGFNVYHDNGNVILHSNTGKTMYHVEAIQNYVNKFGQFKTRHISFGVYFVKAGDDTITNHGYKYGIINDNWKHSEIYVTQLSSGQVYKIDHNNHYDLKGMQSTLQVINY